MGSFLFIVDFLRLNIVGDETTEEQQRQQKKEIKTLDVRETNERK